MNTNQCDEKAIFNVARNIDSAEAVTEYLNQVCGDDPQTRERVIELLRVHQHEESFLESPPPGIDATVDSPTIAEKPGTQIGHYKLMEQIGEGGFGLVFVAQQQQPVRRKVALKIIKPGMDTKEVIARFEAERQALALMDHPNIAQVFDAGTTESGRPYFVMELVKGIFIVDYCDQQQLTARERLDLFVSVCQAVQHAHSKGVIHRDLKPSNILVAPHDGVPVVKVIDFGVAKAIGQQLTDKTIYTQFAQMIGTPMYMSPEQAEINALDVDIRSDVYSLGVLLYELLTGTTPFDRQRFATAAFDEIRRIIREEEPPKPSTRLSTLGATLPEVATKRKMEPGKLAALVKGDLDWIVMKALEKDRSCRYETASALAADVRRFLAEEPIEARPPTAVYRFKKAWRRNRVIYNSVAAVFAAVSIGMVASLWMFLQADMQRKIADNERKVAVAAQKGAEEARTHAHLNLYVADTGAAHRALEEGNLGRARSLLSRYQSKRGMRNVRGFEWRYLWANAQGDYDAVWGEYTGSLGGLTISPDGKLLACSRDHGVDIIRLASGHVERTLRVEGRVHPLKFSPDGRWLVGQNPGYDLVEFEKPGGRIIRWDAQTWAPFDPLPISFPLVFAPDGNTFVAWDEDHLSVWSAETWERVRPLPDTKPIPTRHSLQAIAISHDSHWLYYLSNPFQVVCYDLKLGIRVPTIDIDTNNSRITCLAISTEGFLAVSTFDGKVRLFDVATNELVKQFEKHLSWIAGLVFSSDGSKLFSASADQTIVSYDVRSLSVDRRLFGHDTEIWGFDVARDGKTLVSGGVYGGSVLRWTLDEVTDDTQGRAVRVITPLNDGRLLYYRPQAHDVTCLNIATGDAQSAGMEGLVQEFRPDDFTRLVAVSPDTRWAVGESRDDQGLWLFNSHTGQPSRPLRNEFGRATWASFSDDNRFLVTAGDESEVRLWKTADWTSEPLIGPLNGRFRGVLFSPDSRRLVVGEREKCVVFDIESKSVVFAFDEDSGISSAAISHNGKYLAAGYSDNIIRLWDLEGDHQKGMELRGHVAGVHALAFSPDGRTLASTGNDNRVKLWSTETRREIFTLYTDRDRSLDHLSFSPDGHHLVVYQFVSSGGGSWEFLSSDWHRVWKAPSLAETEAVTKTRMSQSVP